jgi:L-arabinose isomerase
MLNTNLNTIATIFGITATIFGGIIWVVTIIGKVCSKVKEIEMTVDDVKEKLVIVDNRTSSEQKENEAFRHKYKTTVESLYILIESKFTDFSKQFEGFKQLIDLKLDLNTERNKNKSKSE